MNRCKTALQVSILSTNSPPLTPLLHVQIINIEISHSPGQYLCHCCHLPVSFFPAAAPKQYTHLYYISSFVYVYQPPPPLSQSNYSISTHRGCQLPRHHHRHHYQHKQQPRCSMYKWGLSTRSPGHENQRPRG